METCQAATSTREMDNANPTISFGSRPPFTEYTRSVLMLLLISRFNKQNIHSKCLNITVIYFLFNTGKKQKLEC